MRKRIKRIFSEAQKDLDVIVIMNGVAPHIDMSFFYVTGLTSGLFEGCTALCYPDGRMEILTSRLEEESARRANAKMTAFDKRDARDSILKKRLKDVGRIGVNSAELTHSNFKTLKSLTKKTRFVDISEAVVDARVVKDEKEIANLRRAAAIASEVYEELLGSVHLGMREYELAAEISYRMGRKGSSGVAFGTIAAFGENSAEPHYSAGDRTLRKGDFIVVDFGARYNLYCSDITRTTVMGRASKRQKRIYETVLEANELGIDKAREGIEGSTLHNTVKAYIEKKGYKGRFTHGLGHSLGLATHDGRGLNPSTDIILKRNMIFTIEPGIYIPGYGGVRIEDDIVVRKGKCSVLTKATKELIEL